MSENKFIKHLRGKGTAKSVLEVKNQNTPTSFANMPDGSSNANDTYSDYRGNATSVLKGTENWKLDTATLVESATVYGDGRDMTGSYDANGSTLWVDATATFSASRRYSPNTKFVLKLCGNNLLSATEETIDFTLLVNIGTTTVTKTFTIAEQANFFCKEFVIDFSESNGNTIKIAQNDTINVQLLCGDPNASATIYNGMTVFTALQRRVDADAVSSDTRTLDELEEDFEEFMSDTETALNGKVSKTGDTMTGALNIADIASSNTPLLTLTHSSTATYKWNIAPRYNSTTLSVYPGSTETNGFRFATTGFVPASNNARYLGSASLKWKGVYTAMINNGADLSVPNKSGTLATTADVELAARSGRMLTNQGVWYAKMYSATVAPSAEDGTNYADFSQVDNDNNPIIVIYTRTSGAWVQSEIITPPADYDGYVPVTSKIWDIAEQSGQQGGRVLWNHTSKEFTPYPTIISFEDIEVTGNSTVVMPQNSGANQIVNKNYVDEAIAEIPTGGSGLNVGDVFFTMRNDNELNGAVECDGATYNTTDFTGAQSIGALLEAGKIDYVSLSAYSTAISTKGWCDKIGWDGAGNTAFRVPTLNAHIVQTNNIPVVGNGGKTNMYNTAGSTSDNRMALTSTGTIYLENVANSALGFTTDPTKSGIIADTTDTAQLRVMIQLATGATNTALETCTGVLADVAALKYDYVVDFQAPTAANNYTWYRKYKSGWVEQGGKDTASTYGITAKQVVLPVEMADNNYSIMVTKIANTTGDLDGAGVAPQVAAMTTTGFYWSVTYTSALGRNINWRVEGMAA